MNYLSKKKIPIVILSSILLSATSVKAMSVIYNHTGDEISLCSKDKYIAKNESDKEHFLSSNSEDIRYNYDRNMNEASIDRKINNMIETEEHNPTVNTHSVDANEFNSKYNQSNLPITNDVEENNQNRKEIEKTLNILENDSRKARQEIDKQKAQDTVDKAKKEAYEKGRQKEVLTAAEENSPSNPYYLRNVEIARQKNLEKEWKEIEKIYGSDSSTAAGQRPTRNDKSQSVSEYTRGGDNLNQYNVEPGHILRRSIYKPTGLSADEFNSLLAGTGLSGLGQAFVDMENKWGVDGLFCMSVAFHESAKGNSRLAVNNNNLFGMKSSSSGWKKFDSKYDNIVYFGEYMNKSLYKGKSTYEIGNIYCPPNTDHWFECVNTYYQGFLDKILK